MKLLKPISTRSGTNLFCFLLLSSSLLTILGCGNKPVEEEPGNTFPRPTLDLRIEPTHFALKDSMTAYASIELPGTPDEDLDVYLIANQCIGGGRWNIIKETNRELIYRLPLDSGIFCQQDTMIFAMGGEVKLPAEEQVVYYEQEYHLVRLDSLSYALLPIPDTLKVKVFHRK